VKARCERARYGTGSDTEAGSASASASERNEVKKKNGKINRTETAAMASI